jgi:UDP-N-acetylglucosamine 1-carboxyvinyltransferase
MAREAETTQTVQRAVGLRVRELRRARGMTQETMAEKLGMLAPNYARIEQGRQNVTLDTLVRIARALATRTAELFRSPRHTKVRTGRPPKGGRASG